MEQGPVPIHIEELTSNVTVLDGDVPLSGAQLEKLVQLVLRRLEEKHREAGRIREATALHQMAAPPLRVEE
jgi:hypothetical protein